MKANQMTRAKTEQKGRVFSYMRWSSEPQTWGDSERRQEKQAQDWCQREGLVLIDASFSDRGKSAWHGQHRQNGNLGALLKAAREGDTILIEDTDRWSREPVLDSLNALRDTVNRGVQIVFLKTGVRVNKDNFNDPSVLFPNFFGSFLANAENEKRSFHIRQAMEAKRQQIRAGKVPFGRLPAWLAWDAPPNKAERKPVVVEAKAELVRRVFALCIAGKGVQAIERELRNCPPIANHKRSDWNTRFIHRLLKDKAVLGWYVPTDTAGIYPPLITEQVFYTAQAKLAGRRALTVRVACQDHNLFTGLVRCARCGRTLVRHTTRANGHVYTYLLCTGRLRGLAPECTASGLRYEVFEQTLLGLLFQDEAVRRAFDSSESKPSPVDALKVQLTEVEKQSEKIMRLIEGTDAPPKRLLDRLKELETQEAGLSKQIEREQALATTPIPREAYDALKTIDLSDRPRLRGLLHDLIEKIEVKLSENKLAVFFKSVGMPFVAEVFYAEKQPSKD